MSEFSSEDAKIHLETVHEIYTTDGNESKASESISDSDKQILGDWVSQNRDWTTIDDLPNEIFVPLMAPFGDDTDKRVEAQVEIINYMKVWENQTWYQNHGVKNLP